MTRVAVRPEDFDVRDGGVVDRVRDFPGLVEPNVVRDRLRPRVGDVEQVGALLGVESGQRGGEVGVEEAVRVPGGPDARLPGGRGQAVGKVIARRPSCRPDPMCAPRLL